MQRLAAIYENRGLKKETALTVAKELTEYEVLGAHIRDELGINEVTQANPLQAALASGAAFTVGGALPFLVTVFFWLVFLLPDPSPETVVNGFKRFATKRTPSI